MSKQIWIPVLLGAGVALGVSVAVWYVASKRLEQKLGLGGEQLEVQLGAGADALRAEFNRKADALETRIRATITQQVAEEELKIMRQVQTLFNALPGR